MANTLLPIEERSLTPDQVELLDKRRRRGQLYLIVCLQTTIIGTLLTLWSGQDMTYTYGWIRPMAMFNALIFLIALTTGILGIRSRRGINEFFSY